MFLKKMARKGIDEGEGEEKVKRAISTYSTSPNDEMVLRLLNPRSKCFNLVHFQRLSTLANLLLLKSRVSTAGRSCKDSSMKTKPLKAHETNDNRFHCGEFLQFYLQTNAAMHPENLLKRRDKINGDHRCPKC
jgi:hypothetical protein